MAAGQQAHCEFSYITLKSIPRGNNRHATKDSINVLFNNIYFAHNRSGLENKNKSGSKAGYRG